MTERNRSQVQHLLNHECLRAKPCQAPGQLLWALAGGLLAGLASAAVQGSPALPAPPMAAQSSPAVPKPSIPLALWAPARGRKEKDRGVGDLMGGIMALGVSSADPQGTACCVTNAQPARYMKLISGLDSFQ